MRGGKLLLTTSDLSDIVRALQILPHLIQFNIKGFLSYPSWRKILNYTESDSRCCGSNLIFISAVFRRQKLLCLEDFPHFHPM